MSLFGIDLGKLCNFPDWRDVPFHPPTCPGARVYVTRDDLSAMAAGGERFDKEGTFVPEKGHGHARVKCSRLIDGRKGVAGYIVYDGLCSSCAHVESSNRAILRKAAGLPEGGP